MFKDIDAVLFDLDGTLIDSAPDLGAAADKMRTDRGLESLAAELYRPMAGAGARGMLGVAFGMTPDHPDYNAMREEFFVNYEQRMTQLTYVFDGVAELIEQLRERGLAWGVVTNKSMRFAAPLTRSMPLFATAQTVVGGDSTPHAKPHPAPLLEAAARSALRRIAACMWVTMSATWWLPGGGHGDRGCSLRLPRQSCRHPPLGRTSPHSDAFGPAFALAIANKRLK